MTSAFGIDDVSAFSDDEMYNIRTLYLMKRHLMSKKERGELGKEKDVLKALEWIFEVLSEISVVEKDS